MPFETIDENNDLASIVDITVVESSQKETVLEKPNPVTEIQATVHTTVNKENTTEAVKNISVIHESSMTITLDDLLMEETPIVSDQESTSLTTDQETTPSQAVNQESTALENEFQREILLSENPVRSEDDFDMLEDLKGFLNEDRSF